MTGLLIIFALLAMGFAAGYGTRELVSRRRHVQYLRFQPYTSSTIRPRSTKIEHSAPEPLIDERPRTNYDITGSFQDLFIRKPKPAKSTGLADANLRRIQTHRPGLNAASLNGNSSPTVDAEQSLEELVALLQRRGLES